MENYQRKIFELLEAGKLKRGELANLDVRHDSWCARLNRIGPCNCDPDITVYPSQDVDDFITTFFALQNSVRRH